MWRHHSNSTSRFADRVDAGQRLGKALMPILAGVSSNGLIVLGLARGGVVVAAEVAAALGAELDACVVRKIGSPMQPELAIGAVGPNDVTVYNRDLIADMGLSEATVNQLTDSVKASRDRLDELVRDGRPAPDLRGKTAILVDDGLATGASMRAALEFAAASAEQVVIAVPTAASEVVNSFEALGVRTIALMTPAGFGSVGAWYDRFDEVTSAQARALVSPEPSANDTAKSGPPG
jgi:predicted phosphoribosyltransferase